MSLIQLRELQKTYKTGKLEFEALKGVDLDIEEGQLVAIVGPSGSGKSTLLNMITGIDHPSSGAGQGGGHRRARTQRGGNLPAWRGRQPGNRLPVLPAPPVLTAFENVMLPMDFCNLYSPRRRRERALDCSTCSGWGSRRTSCRPPFRGAAAAGRHRPFPANDPPIIGDEPTGNLDSEDRGTRLRLLPRPGGGGQDGDHRHPRPRHWPRRPE